jgi:hypothetical protein
MEPFSRGGMAILDNVVAKDYREAERVGLLLKTILVWSKNRIAGGGPVSLSSGYDRNQPPPV